jgi:hypothetical protein
MKKITRKFIFTLFLVLTITNGFNGVLQTSERTLTDSEIENVVRVGKIITASGSAALLYATYKIKKLNQQITKLESELKLKKASNNPYEIRTKLNSLNGWKRFYKWFLTPISLLATLSGVCFWNINYFQERLTEENELKYIEKFIQLATNHAISHRPMNLKELEYAKEVFNGIKEFLNEKLKKNPWGPLKKEKLENLKSRTQTIITIIDATLANLDKAEGPRRVFLNNKVEELPDAIADVD